MRTKGQGQKRPVHRFRGNGWSQKGTKAQRKMQREMRKRERFYAVAVGLRPGIYRSWAESSKQVNGYKGAVHESFPTLEEAQFFMRMHRQHIPNRAHIPFPSAPKPPPEEYVRSSSMAPAIHIAPAYITREQFAPVEKMARRIAADPENTMLDVPECQCPNCPYSREGPPMLQRFLLLRRLYQLNSVLPATVEADSDYC